MRHRSLTLGFLAAVLAASPGPSSAIECPPCGPLYCKNDPAFPAALKSKKDQLAKAGYPAKFIALLDKGGHCLVCVGSGSPDVFTVLAVKPNGDNRTILWDEDNERIAQNQIKSGELAAYYVYNARKACTCCQELKAEERSDYDAQLGLNRNTAIKCVKGAGGTVACS
jgi:hypothetical protein